MASLGFGSSGGGAEGSGKRPRPALRWRLPWLLDADLLTRTDWLSGSSTASMDRQTLLGLRPTVTMRRACTGLRSHRRPPDPPSSALSRVAQKEELWNALHHLILRACVLSTPKPMGSTNAGTHGPLFSRSSETTRSKSASASPGHERTRHRSANNWQACRSSGGAVGRRPRSMANVIRPGCTGGLSKKTSRRRGIGQHALPETATAASPSRYGRQE